MKSLEYKYSIIPKEDNDIKQLQTYNDKCKLLKNVVNNLSGISISCKLEEDKFSEVQLLNYLSIQEDEINSTYLEAGGIYPNFHKDQSIYDVERIMNQSGYKCTKK